MGVRLTNPMTGTSKTFGPDEDEQSYRMLGWHDADPVSDMTPEEAPAPTPEPSPEAPPDEGEQKAQPKPKKSAEAPPPENQESSDGTN